MNANGERDEARDQAVNETLDLIETLDIDQARSLLRCFAIDEENFDSHALETVAKTVRATCDRSGNDYDALCHFPSGSVARLNREHLLEALAASAEAETVQMDGAADILAADLGDLEFEKLETRRLIREGHVTINHYYMNKAPDAQPEPKPEQKPEKKPPYTVPTKPLSHMCARCHNLYFKEDNILLEDGRGPCRVHTDRRRRDVIQLFIHLLEGGRRNWV
ncbi:hypothetical protein DHEL01_v212620 [Diaporthe helianthi]|uniref:Uncharacterized protein n=1 Tax=Diaporthe helianthi TaxID=158607 RepID=A0A2P5HFE9_DIAHE|nr:hypothetical protein DHEL01_v212620 [Diaporthe helianthi]